MTQHQENYFHNMSYLNGQVEAWLQSIVGSNDPSWVKYAATKALVINQTGWENRFENTDTFKVAIESASAEIQRLDF